MKFSISLEVSKLPKNGEIFQRSRIKLKFLISFPISIWTNTTVFYASEISMFSDTFEYFYLIENFFAKDGKFNYKSRKEEKKKWKEKKDESHVV